MKKVLNLCLLIFLILNCTQINSQSESSKSIALINGVAHLVEVAPNGDLLEIYQSIDDYFTSPESHQEILRKLSPGAVSQGKSIILFEDEQEFIPSFTKENKEPVKVGNEQYVAFSPDKAILQKPAVDQIRKIARNFKAGGVKNITINSFAKDSYRSRALSRNRAKAIQDLLVAFGVSNKIINSNSVPGGIGTKIDFVQILFKN